MRYRRKGQPRASIRTSNAPRLERRRRAVALSNRDVSRLLVPQPRHETANACRFPWSKVLRARFATRRPRVQIPSAPLPSFPCPGDDLRSLGRFDRFGGKEVRAQTLGQKDSGFLPRILFPAWSRRGENVAYPPLPGAMVTIQVGELARMKPSNPHGPCRALRRSPWHRDTRNHLSAAQCVVDGGADSDEILFIDCSNVSREHCLGNGVETIAVDR